MTQIKAALPRLASTESCLCSSDPALMRNSTPLPRHIIPFPLCLAPFTFTQYHYGLILPSWDQGWVVFAMFIIKFSSTILHVTIQFSSCSSSCESQIDYALANTYSICLISKPIGMFARTVQFQSMSENKGWKWV